MNRLLQPRGPAMAAAVVCIGLLIGAVVALVSSPGSLASRSTSYSPMTAATATRSSPVPTPTPTPLKPGTLSVGATLVAAGTELIAIDSTGARQSNDQGLTWSEPNLPAGGSGIVVDRGNPNFRLAGGPTLLETSDGGATWKAPKLRPPGAPPFTPIMVNPADSTVWFVAGNGHLLRTRDGGISWRALAGLPTVTAAHMAAMATTDHFILAIGTQVFELIDNGNQIKTLPPLPSGQDVRLAMVGAVDPPPIVAVTDTGHAYSFRSGAWTEISGGLTGPLDGLPSGRAWVGDGGAHLGSQGQMMVTTDGGGAWSAATGLPPDQSVEAIAGLGPSGNSVWAYCAAGDIYHSSDGGLTWSLVSPAFRA